MYLVAYIDQIHIYAPQFPSQVLSSRPELVLNLPASRPGLSGYLDPSNPHAVNHLVVGDLGEEEIVVASCDDGDVIAYTMRSISNRITERELGEPYRKPSPADLRPFFIQNVMRSAWGLAVHKSGRMIAVGANSHNVTVFAFALRQGESGGSAECSDDESELNNDSDLLTCNDDIDWSPIAKSLEPPDRSVRNIVITLSGHHANIPSVCFCNSEDDLDGRYLVSTDIRGTILLWDVWAQIPIMKQSMAGANRPTIFGSIEK